MFYNSILSSSKNKAYKGQKVLLFKCKSGSTSNELADLRRGEDVQREWMNKN